MSSPANLQAQIERSMPDVVDQTLGSDNNGQQTSVAPAMDALTKYKDLLKTRLSSLKDMNLTGQITHDVESCYINGGGFGDIQIGKYCIADSCQMKVAVKTLRVYLHNSPDGIKLFEREIRVWSRLKHPNILPLLGYIVNESGLPALISEFIENGTVFKYISENPECNIHIIHMTLGIAEGISYLHNSKVIHSDIKADNVLVSSSGDPLICDFGLSRIIAASHSIDVLTQSGTLRGNARWTSPELLQPPNEHVTYSEQSDIWAFGMTIYEILTGRRPFYRLKLDLQVMLAIIQGTLPEKPESSQTWSESQDYLWKIYEACCQKDPSARPSAAQIAEDLRTLEKEIQHKDDSFFTVEVRFANRGESTIIMKHYNDQIEALNKVTIPGGFTHAAHFRVNVPNNFMFANRTITKMISRTFDRPAEIAIHELFA